MQRKNQILWLFSRYRFFERTAQDGQMKTNEQSEKVFSFEVDQKVAFISRTTGGNRTKRVSIDVLHNKG